LSSTGKPAEAEVEIRTALAIRRKLADDNPTVTNFRSRQADSHRNLGTLLSITGRPAESESERRASLAICRKLADDNPAVTEFRSFLAMSHVDLGSLLAEMDKPAGAEHELLEVVPIYRKLADDNPKVPAFRNGLATALIELGDVARRRRPAMPTSARSRSRNGLPARTRRTPLPKNVGGRGTAARAGPYRRR